MELKDHLAAVNATERQIASLLSRLERETGWHVAGIQIRTDEVTQVSDSSPRHRRSIEIDLRPAPHSDWAM